MSPKSLRSVENGVRLVGSGCSRNRGFGSGFSTLFGIATRNRLTMIAYLQHLVEREGVRDPVMAGRRAAMERLSPILMTALAAGLALIPLGLGAGEPGSEIWAPMAIVILLRFAGGLMNVSE